jgi:hypothetical protein
MPVGYLMLGQNEKPLEKLKQRAPTAEKQFQLWGEMVGRRAEQLDARVEVLPDLGHNDELTQWFQKVIGSKKGALA